MPLRPQTLFIALLLLLSACNKPDPLTQFGYTGEATADWNGEVNGWRAHTLVKESSVLDDVYNIDFHVRTPETFLRQALVIFSVTTAPTVIYPFPLSRPPTFEEITIANVEFYTYDADGDAGCHKYVIDTTYQNVLEINEFDPTSFRIRGTFDLRYLKVGMSACPIELPDTVHLANGVFSVNGLTARD